jgi:hypothetical protein
MKLGPKRVTVKDGNQNKMDYVITSIADFFVGVRVM